MERIMLSLMFRCEAEEAVKYYVSLLSSVFERLERFCGQPIMARRNSRRIVPCRR